MISSAWMWTGQIILLLPLLLSRPSSVSSLVLVSFPKILSHELTPEMLALFSMSLIWKDAEAIFHWTLLLRSQPNLYQRHESGHLWSFDEERSEFLLNYPIFHEILYPFKLIVTVPALFEMAFPVYREGQNRPLPPYAGLITAANELEDWPNHAEFEGLLLHILRFPNSAVSYAWEEAYYTSIRNEPMGRRRIPMEIFLISTYPRSKMFNSIPGEISDELILIKCLNLPHTDCPTLHRINIYSDWRQYRSFSSDFAVAFKAWKEIIQRLQLLYWSEVLEMRKVLIMSVIFDYLFYPVSDHSNQSNNAYVNHIVQVLEVLPTEHILGYKLKLLLSHLVGVYPDLKIWVSEKAAIYRSEHIIPEVLQSIWTKKKQFLLRGCRYAGEAEATLRLPKIINTERDLRSAIRQLTEHGHALGFAQSQIILNLKLAEPIQYLKKTFTTPIALMTRYASLIIRKMSKGETWKHKFSLVYIYDFLLLLPWFMAYGERIYLDIFPVSFKWTENPEKLAQAILADADPLMTIDFAVSISKIIIQRLKPLLAYFSYSDIMALLCG